VSGRGARGAPGTSGPALIEGLRRAAGPADVLIRDNRALREASLVVFDRTFAITAVLRLLAALVAFAGVLSALMALGLERVHEMGGLRAHGLTPAQVWGLPPAARSASLVPVAPPGARLAAGPPAVTRPAGPAPIRATVSVARALTGGDDAGFARALRPRPLAFPPDHGPHPAFRTEWWYYTGNLT